MKKLQSITILALLLTFFAATGISAQEAPAQGKTAIVKIKTSGECEMCKESIEKEVNLMKGVKSAVLDIETKVLTVEYNPKKTSPDKIRTVISNLGYDADEVKANNRTRRQLPDCCKAPGGEGMPKADSAR
jgi:periplasmic mercuric ion binding protein